MSQTVNPWTGKLLYRPTFEFKTNGSDLTGMVRLDGWPQDAPIADGKIDGGRLSFAVTHQEPYRLGRSVATMTSHLPKLKFIGTVEGAEMTLIAIPIVSDVDGNEREGRAIEMKETKIAE